MKYPSNNKRIAKNTLYLYIRMLLSMAVSLYTSRIVLQVLGVEDFGIYGVVGGVVSFLTFINASMSGATSRFLTIELGKGNHEGLSKVFNMAFYEHCGIALIILIIAETIGLWFVNTQLIIPEHRMTAANWVYQMSILSMMVSVTQVPYRASIIAHENMDVFAIIEILNVTLKLFIVYLLLLGESDKLILYGSLVLCVTIFVSFVYRCYCHIRYKECHLRMIWDKTLFTHMTSYSGWDLYGNLSNVARNHGVAILLNMFFGPVMNAASTIATQAGSAVMSFASNVTTAVKPQIIKYYAQNRYEEMSNLMHQAVRVNFLILSFIAVPLILELHFVIMLWLKIVPDYSVAFCSLILIFNFFANTSNVVITGIHATGHIKKMSIILGTLYLLVIPLTFISFKLGAEPWVPFLINACAVFCGMSSNAYMVSRRIREFSIKEFFISDILRCVVVALLAGFLGYTIQKVMDECFGRLVLTIIITTISLSIMGYRFVLPSTMASAIRLKIVNICNTR